MEITFILLIIMFLILLFFFNIFNFFFNTIKLWILSLVVFLFFTYFLPVEKNCNINLQQMKINTIKNIDKIPKNIVLFVPSYDIVYYYLYFKSQNINNIQLIKDEHIPSGIKNLIISYHKVLFMALDILLKYGKKQLPVKCES